MCGHHETQIKFLCDESGNTISPKTWLYNVKFNLTTNLGLGTKRVWEKAVLVPHWSITVKVLFDCAFSFESMHDQAEALSDRNLLFTNISL